MEARINKLTRVESWPQVLADFIAAADRPFVWGEWDCCLMAADCVYAMTGVDVAAEFRGRYKTARGALRVMHGSLAVTAQRVAQAHCLPETNPALAQRGDICLVATSLGDALGICVGAKIACTGPDGLVMLPLTAARSAWRT